MDLPTKRPRLPKCLPPAAALAAVVLSAVLSHYATLASRPEPLNLCDIGQWSCCATIETDFLQPPTPPIYLTRGGADEQPMGDDLLVPGAAPQFISALDMFRLEPLDLPYDPDDPQWHCMYQITLSAVPYASRLEAEQYREKFLAETGQALPPDIVILVCSAGIVVDGAGYKLSGPGSGTSGAAQMLAGQYTYFYHCAIGQRDA